MPSAGQADVTGQVASDTTCPVVCGLALMKVTPSSKPRMRITNSTGAKISSPQAKPPDPLLLYRSTRPLTVLLLRPPRPALACEG
jgi:hypothetical protein